MKLLEQLKMLLELKFQYEITNIICAYSYGDISKQNCKHSWDLNKNPIFGTIGDSNAKNEVSIHNVTI